ncbi:signal recognition particle-docking protein FtsY [Treponema endosymbiont of Eucomonympha sp.]|uniref:signal recognition particle-docking protein FtsY n=1 Tax=Treponema endosymbiont of Eucomonympha sp. TaxID=1580831 RepID=UPI000780B647|nr:signal recognition particle-docking protein FtsY [Treponema endosymbiont of Eucomonympha sp.]
MASLAEKLKSLLGISRPFDESFFEELTDALIEGDIGAKTAVELVDALEKTCRQKRVASREAVLESLRDALLPYMRSTELKPEAGKTSIYLVLGVNGVGKTTTVAKLARFFRDGRAKNVVIAACDTFRAAAIEQLAIHGERLGIRVIMHQHGSDPAAVAFDAAASVSAQGGGLVLADTAGRLHNKENLIRELQKIDRVAASKADAGCYKKLLVVDATTGQNALRQAEVFHEAVGVDAVILTKYDSTARGGAAFSISKELSIPAAYIGFGEKYRDIDVFNSAQYLTELVGSA